MGINPKRTPDGLNRTSGGGAGGTPTPKIVTGIDYPLTTAVNGKGIRFEAGNPETLFSFAGFGFDADDVANRIALEPVPGGIPPATPATLAPGSFGFDPPVGDGPARSSGFIDASAGADAVGLYVFSVTTITGKTGCIRVQIDPAN